MRVELGDRVIGKSNRTLRVLETSHPPVFYIPRSDIDATLLRPSARTSFCEFKGEASYLDVIVGARESREAAWEYRDPRPAFESLRDHVAFYPGRVDACYVDGELVLAQEGDLFGGWITSEIVGPYKGAPGTRGW